MKTKGRRVFAAILLLLFTLPLFFTLWNVIQKLTDTSEPTFIWSPYSGWDQYDEVLRNNQTVNLWQNHIYDSERDVRMSFYPYSHINAEYGLPASREGSAYFRLRKVRYKFQVIDDQLQILSTEFFSDKHWRTLYEKEGTLYEKPNDTHWPFTATHMVCEVPLECGFYDPIAISGLDGCGIILLSSDDPGLETDITLYLFNGRTWDKVNFELADGTSSDCLRGYVRRKTDSNNTSNSKIGTMEICIKNKNDIYILYQVSYSDNAIVLIPDIDTKISTDDLLNWAY